MATAKKSPAKKTATKTKAPVKKSVVSKKKTAKKVAALRSFTVVSDSPFFSTKITKQTIYWSILLIVILVTQLWILNVQLDVIQSLDALNATK
jgi:hypothetical protein